MEPFSVVVHFSLVVAQIVATWRIGFAHLSEVADEIEDEYDDMSAKARSRARANARIETFFGMIGNGLVVITPSYLFVSVLHGSFNPVSFVTVPVTNFVYDALDLYGNWTAIWLLSFVYLLVVAYLLAACSAYMRQMIESSCETAYFSEREADQNARSRPVDAVRALLALRNRRERTQESR